MKLRQALDQVREWLWGSRRRQIGAIVVGLGALVAAIGLPLYFTVLAGGGDGDERGQLLPVGSPTADEQAPTPTAPSSLRERTVPDTAESRPCASLEPQCEAQVTNVAPQRLNVRDGPGTSTNQIGKLTEGETVCLTTSSSFKEGFDWWRIRSQDGVVGWVAERDPSDSARAWLTSTNRKCALRAVVDPDELFIVDADGGEPQLVHGGAGWINFLIWSPNGNALAFVANPSGRNEVYVADGASEPVLVLDLAAGERFWRVERMLWSPEGDVLAVHTRTNATLDDRMLQSRILLIDAHSGSQVEIDSETVPDTAEYVRLVSWLPDGSSVLVGQGGDGGLVVINTATGEKIDVASGLGDVRSASLSPDGSQMAVVAGSPTQACSSYGMGGVSILIVDIESGIESESLTDACGILSLTWSPDGRDVAYMITEGERGTYVLDVASGQVRNVTTIQTKGGEVTEWLADGSALAIQRCYEGCYEAVLAPISGGGEQELVALERRYAFGGFAPDSRRYVYADDAVRVATLGGEVRALTASDPASGYKSLSWSPTGEQVAYVRGPNLVPRRYAVEIETNEVSRLPSPADIGFCDLSCARQPVLSPDKTEMAFWRIVPEDPRLELHVEPCRVGVLFDCTRADPAEEGQRRLLWRFDDLRYGLPGPPVWSPDGRSVAVRTASGIFTVNADGSGITHLVETRASGRAYSDLAWSEDGRRILITSSYQGI